MRSPERLLIILWLMLGGPIVRVTPHELSIRDADFHDKIYVTASVRPTEIYNHYVDGVDFKGLDPSLLI